MLVRNNDSSCESVVNRFCCPRLDSPSIHRLLIADPNSIPGLIYHRENNNNNNNNNRNDYLFKCSISIQSKDPRMKRMKRFEVRDANKTRMDAKYWI